MFTISSFPHKFTNGTIQYLTNLREWVSHYRRRSLVSITPTKTSPKNQKKEKKRKLKEEEKKRKKLDRCFAHKLRDVLSISSFILSLSPVSTITSSAYADPRHNRWCAIWQGEVSDWRPPQGNSLLRSVSRRQCLRFFSPHYLLSCM